MYFYSFAIRVWGLNIIHADVFNQKSMELQIIYKELLELYLQQVPNDLKRAFDALKDAELSTPNFSFYTSVASVFSSKIEGESIELDSYIKHKRDGIPFQPDYTKKIDDLHSAYLLAQQNTLNENNVKEAHKLSTKHIVDTAWQGRYRVKNMYVTTDDGSVEYVVFVKIHPWNDGNGRSARLIEKWFLAQKLGEKAWFIQSEKMYYRQHQTYYKNIRALGLEYGELDCGKAMPFLLMLPSALNNE